MWQARQNLVLSTDLQLLYLITPHFRNLRKPCWQSFERVFKHLTVSELAAADVLSIHIEYIFAA